MAEHEQLVVPFGTVLYVTIVGNDCAIMSDDKLSKEALLELKEKVIEHIDKMVETASPEAKGSLH